MPTIGLHWRGETSAARWHFLKECKTHLMNSKHLAAPGSPKSADRRNYALDLLRGVAVLLVLALHTPVPDSWDSAGGVLGAAMVVRNLGWAGVDLFFVLSGFLISGLLFVELKESGKLDVGRFWMRRGMKIWPSYFAAYGIMFFLTLALQTGLLGRPFLPTARDSSIAAIPNVLFVQNYIWPETRWFASWSLAIEEHFYLVLPIVVAGIAALRRQWQGRSIVAACIAACVGVPIMRHFACGGEDQDLSLMQTHLRGRPVLRRAAGILPSPPPPAIHRGGTLLAAVRHRDDCRARLGPLLPADKHLARRHSRVHRALPGLRWTGRARGGIPTRGPNVAPAWLANDHRRLLVHDLRGSSYHTRRPRISDRTANFRFVDRR